MSHQTQPRSKVSNSTILLLVVLLAIAAFLIGASGFGSVGAQNNPPGGPNPIVTQFAKPVEYVGLTGSSFPPFLQNPVNAALEAVGAGPNAASKYFDPLRTSYHFSGDGKTLTLAALPVVNSRTATLGDTTNQITTPDDNVAAQIVGSLYAPQIANNNNAYIIVYTLDSKKIRLYDISKKQVATSIPIIMRTFTGVTVAQSTQVAATQAATMAATEQAPGASFDLTAQIAGTHPSVGDAGSIIATRETCVTVGLNQICIELPIQDDFAQKKGQAALDDLSQTFTDLTKLPFDVDGAISDVVGDQQRSTCGKSLLTADNAATVAAQAACQPTAVWVALSGAPQSIASFPDKNAQVIGILSVLSNNQTGNGLRLDTTSNDAGELYDGSDGGKTVKHIDALPVGNYLILATEANLQPGTETAIYLAGAKSTYLTHGVKIEAFGKPVDPQAYNQPWQAFDTDGGAGGVWCP